MMAVRTHDESRDKLRLVLCFPRQVITSLSSIILIRKATSEILMDDSEKKRPSRIKFITVIAGAAIMVAAALAFYINWQQGVEMSSRIYEESPDLMAYAEENLYNMTKGTTMQIPIIIEINQKGREVNAQIAVFSSGEIDIPKDVFIETGERTLPAGFVGSLDRSGIYLPADEQSEIRTETVFLTLTSKDEIASRDYSLSPTLFGKDIAGNPFTVSSSFVVHVQ